MNANQVNELLKARHEKNNDIYVPECNDGPSMRGGNLRIDGLAIARSWTRPRISAYEIKVSRQDFLRDEKAHLYKKLCNVFYFVAPKGLIRPDELDLDTGLIEVSKNCKRLVTVKKATYREIEPPTSLYLYILFSRSTIIGQSANKEFSKADHWEQLLKENADSKRYGHLLGKRIGEKIKRDITEVQEENRRLMQENRMVQGMRRMLEESGIDFNESGISPHYQLRRKVDHIKGVIPFNFKFSVQEAIKGLRIIQDELEQMESEGEEWR